MAARSKTIEVTESSLQKIIDSANQTEPTQLATVYTNEPEDEAMSDIERIQDQLGRAPSEDAKISILRVVEMNKKEPWLFDTTPADFDYSYILQNYGGGKYRVQGLYPKGCGKRGFFVNRILEIEEPVGGIPKLLATGSPQTNDAVLSAINTLGSSIKDAMLGMVQAISQTQPREDTEEKFLSKMMLYKQIFSPAPQADPLDMIDKILSVKSKFDELGGDGEKSFLSQAADMAKPLLQGYIAQQANKPSTQTENRPIENTLQINGQSNISTTPLPPANPPIEENSMPINQIFIWTILNAAKKNADPITYANLILDQMPDEMIDALVDNQNWFAELCSAIPEAANYKPWFESVHAEIIAELTAPEESDTSAETGTPSAQNGSGTA